MAPSVPKPKHPLDTLSALIDDVLVQTGKALRVSQNLSNDDLSGPFQPKLPGILERFHNTLDDVDFEIIRAKAVFERDLAQLREKKAAPAAAPTPEIMINQPPKPVDSQTKEPMVIDLDSSPAAEETYIVKDETPAPFPDMGMGVDLSSLPKPANTPTSPVKKTSGVKQDSASSTVPAVPVPNMDSSLAPPKAEMKNEAPVASMDDNVSSFTDMEFTVDPSTNDHFAGEGLSLEEVQARNNFQGTAEDPADGMDFDFTLDDDFNSYMDSRAENLQMGDNDFNNAYFNVGSTSDA